MTDTLIVLFTVALFVGFGLLRRNGRDCPGADDCTAEEAVAGCAGCPSLHREEADANR